MIGSVTDGVRRHAIALLALLTVAALTYCHHIRGPIVDGMAVKQVYIANKARSIARPPFDLFRNTFDFLDPEGRRLALTEEAPLYTGGVGLAYRLFGEHDWLGRAWSILAALAALFFYYDLLKREFSRGLALLATFLLAWCPLLLYYGRAVQPDSSMLACMLAAACAHHRYLERKQRRWWLAAAAAGALGALFKYYGLMVLLPLADMTRRRHGWRACFGPAFLLLGAALVGPVAVWTGAAFVSSPNPTHDGAYFLFQMPELLLGRPHNLYLRFIDRFLYKDCGWVNALLIAPGLGAAAFGRARPGPMAAWTVMGVLFFFLLGPKLQYHDYYELMMLPAAAFWAALGWNCLWGAAWTDRVSALPWKWGGAAALAVAAVVQSPWVAASKFDQEIGSKILGERLRLLCSPSGRVLVAGRTGLLEAIHYSRHEGWALWGNTLPSPWRQDVATDRSLGAEYVAVYLDGGQTPEERQSYLPLVSALPVVEHRSGPWSAGKRPAEYYILRLHDLDSAAGQERIDPPPGSRPPGAP